MRFHLVPSVLILLIFLSACTPQVQEWQPQPQEKSMQSWLPKSKPKAVIVALHGFNDYSNAFALPGEYLKTQKIAVYAYDQRGFGKTSQTGIWAGQENLTADLKAMVERIQAKYPRTPIYILGESMGAAVAIVALSQPDFPKVKGVILSAPAVWGAGAMSPIYRGSLWLAAHSLPFRELTGSDLKIVACSNYPMLVSMYNDPLVIKKTRVDAVYGLVGLMGSAYEALPKLKTPILLLYGAKDQVIPAPAVELARTRITAPLTYHHYPDGYHMLLRDLEREVVLDDIVAWVSK
jgi:acylglycerol lipase